MTAKPATPAMLNHAAFVTHDTLGMADFFERVMGMELVQAILDEKIPSTGEEVPYFHSFFRMADGSTLAFFEAPELPPKPEPSHPAYKTFEHFAMHVPTTADVDEWKVWLESNGLDVLGPVDHKVIYSIYFHAPDGMRLEITTNLTPDWNTSSTRAHHALDEWREVKEDAAARGIPLAQALAELTARRSHQRGLDADL